MAEIRSEYPLALRRGHSIFVEERKYRVHRKDFYEEERFGPLANKVLVETTTGVQLAFPLAYPVEVHA
jgi:hypothetical protein